MDKAEAEMQIARLAQLDRKDRRIAELEAALREARSMLAACGLDEPDDELQASWDRGLAKIDSALSKSGR